MSQAVFGMISNVRQRTEASESAQTLKANTERYKAGSIDDLLALDVSRLFEKEEQQLTEHDVAIGSITA